MVAEVERQATLEEGQEAVYQAMSVEFALKVVDALGLQVAFLDPAPVTVEPEPEPRQVIDDRQLGFDWWIKWPSPTADDPQRLRTSRRRPVRANKHYALALADYLENRTGRGSAPDELTKTEAKTLKQALAIISEKTIKFKAGKDGSVDLVGDVAACGALWWHGGREGEKRARPCGCHNTRICTLCALAEADKLSAGANDFIFKEVLPAAQPYLKGRLECVLRTPTVPVHKAISRRLEQIQLEEKDLDRWRDEVNGLGRDAWDVLQMGHPEGRIAGPQNIQLYGEGNPGEAHIHFHHSLIPIVLEDQLREGGDAIVVDRERLHWVVQVRPIKAMVSKELMKNQRWEWGRRQLLAAKRLNVPLPTVAGFISRERLAAAFRRQTEALAVMDNAQAERAKAVVDVLQVSNRAKAEKVKAALRVATWDRRIVDIRERHLENAVKLSPAMEGDIHHAFRRIGPDGYKKAKGAVSYASRSPLTDLVSGLQGEDRYTWTGPKLYDGEQPDASKHGPAAKWTGIITKGGNPVFERELPPQDVVRAIARIAEVPAKWPRLRWMGWTSQGKIKAVMEALGWERAKREKVEPQGSGDLVVPVARWDDGLRFEYVSDRGQQLMLTWAELLTMPVNEAGRSKVGGRRSAWHPRDGPP